MSRWDDDKPRSQQWDKRSKIVLVGLVCAAFALIALYEVATPINPNGSVPMGNCDQVTGQCYDSNGNAIGSSQTGSDPHNIGVH